MRGAFMTESIHGHEVMRKMIQSGKSHTQDSLRAAIGEWFGDAARFHTCSAENMTADELIAFLAARSKFYSDDAGFRVNEAEICDHA
jgi:probable metal-binding protein